MTLTAETITVDQLQGLRAEAVEIVAGSSPYHLVLPMRERPGVELLYAAIYALGEENQRIGWYDVVCPNGRRAEYMAEGRRYCAELINARMSAS